MSRELRDALGCFATGVTVVTTRYKDEDIGMTCSSFNSVSLDPAMALWSIQKNAASLEAFQKADGYTVSVLGANQGDLAMHFTKGEQAERFEGLSERRAPSGRVIMPNCIAWFDCDLHQVIEAGDHDILLANIMDYDCTTHGAGLIFERSQFGSTQMSKVA